MTSAQIVPFLEKVKFPAAKAEIKKQVKKAGGSADVLQTLDKLEFKCYLRQSEVVAALDLA